MFTLIVITVTIAATLACLLAGAFTINDAKTTDDPSKTRRRGLIIMGIGLAAFLWVPWVVYGIEWTWDHNTRIIDNLRSTDTRLER